MHPCFVCRWRHRAEIAVGLRAGPAHNTPPFHAKDKFSDASSLRSGWYGVRLAFYRGSRLQLGIGLDYGRYRYGFSGVNAHTGTLGFVVALPVALPHLFANYRLKPGPSGMYAGLMAGYAIAGRKLNIVEINGLGSVQWRDARDRNGMAAGVQAGYHLELSKRWAAQFEAAARFVMLRTSYPDFAATSRQPPIPYNNAALSLPITVGLSCKL